MITFGTWGLAAHKKLRTIEVDCTYPQRHSMAVYSPGNRDSYANGAALSFPLMRK